MLKPNFFIHSIIIEGKDSDFLSRIQQHLKNCDKIVEKGLLNKEKDWKEDERIVSWKDRLYVPIDKKLRTEIIAAHHDSTVAGHPG